MLTAEWEQKLTEIARGGADPDTFMDGIRTMVQETVSTYSCISEDGKKLFAPEKEVIGTCPRCGQPVYEGKKNFACSDRSCGFVLWKMCIRDRDLKQLPSSQAAFPVSPSPPQGSEGALRMNAT